MRRFYFFITLLLIHSQINAANRPSELALEYYIDSIIMENDLDYEKSKAEFLSYTKKNYKSMDNIQDFVTYSANKMKSKEKEYTKNYTKEYNEWHAFALMSHRNLKKLEKKTYQIINKNSTKPTKDLMSYLFTTLHEINYWELNCYKPNLLGKRLNKLYNISENFDLIEKLSLIILSAKIYKASYFVNPMYICQSLYAKTKIRMDIDSLNLNTKNLTIDSIPEGIKPPGFVGGTTMMTEYIKDNMKYPEKALSLKQEGKVLTSFKVDESGYIYDIKIKQSPSEYLSKEAIRTIESFPQWKSHLGTKNGAGFTKFTLPFVFSLPEEK